MASVSIYAELLLNIRQISVQVSLPSPCSATTSVSLSAERDALSVSHDGNIAQINLPAAVKEGHVPTIDLRWSREPSLRLPVAEGAAKHMRSIEAGHTTHPIWSASDMTPTSQIACRTCQALLVKDSVSTWKDLPSEDWAEMMEFWHCHKPDTDDQLLQTQNGCSKGYSAANGIKPTNGVGLHDTMSLLLSPTDVTVIRVTTDVNDDTVKLYKWEVRFRTTASSAWQEYPADKFVTAQLLGMIESQGVKRFVVHDGNDEEDGMSLLIWVFNTNIVYSSTSVSESSRRAMKLYYKTIINPTEILEQEGLKADELILPNNVPDNLHSILKASTQLLPVPARNYKDWSVGLLDH
ncbi:MAG: hypothetical protein Q9170_000390 [Blastenia crenularia]